MGPLRPETSHSLGPGSALLRMGWRELRNRLSVTSYRNHFAVFNSAQKLGQVGLGFRSRYLTHNLPFNRLNLPVKFTG